MDDAGALGRLGPGPERPGPALLVPRGQEGTPPEQVVGSAGDAWQRALAEAQALEELAAFARLQLGRFRLQLHADTEHLAVAAELVGNRLHDGVGVAHLVLA